VSLLFRVFRNGRAAALAVCLASVPGAAFAGDAAEGLRLAQKWCSPCHIVNGGQANASDVAPPFTQIANDPDRTTEKLAAWLAAPHSPMPDLNLSQNEIDDLIAHIQSLKAE
jgi:mono/diheme cytochrome c family protein